jgi:hypothetical protein
MAFLITKPLEKHKAEYIERINQIASDKILLNYPLYKQLNILRENDDVVKSLMASFIDTIRSFADEAKISIGLSDSIPEMLSIIRNYSTAIYAL